MSAPERPRGVRGPDVRMHVGESAVTRIAAQATLRVPGVVGLRADLTQMLLGFANSALRNSRSALPTDGVTSRVAGTSAEVGITLVTRLGHNCRDVAQAVQVAVAADVAELTALDALVSVTIADVRLD